MFMLHFDVIDVWGLKMQALTGAGAMGSVPEMA